MGVLTCKLDTTGFEAMTSGLARIFEVPVPDVIKSEVSAVLSACIKRTPAGKTATIIQGKRSIIQRKFRTYAAGRSGVSDTYLKGTGLFFESAKSKYPQISMTNGKTWWREGGKFYVMAGPGMWGGMSAAPGNNMSRRNGDQANFYAHAAFNQSRYTADGGHWSASRWARYQAEEADRLQDLASALKDMEMNVKRSHGITKQSWLQCADDAGLRAELRGVPAYVDKAITSTGKRFKNGTAREGKSSGQYFMTIVNSSPLAINVEQAYGVLQWAINGRLEYFYQNVERGFFGDLKKAAARYPGLKLK